MTPEFLAAVIDSLLPGEPVAPAGHSALPAGCKAGLDPGAYSRAHRSIFEAIDAAAFMRADEAARTAILQAIECVLPDAFRSLLVVVLSDYYESAAVLAAIGWRAEPPQPTGHAMATIDEATRESLQQVARRERLWR
jgi:hypothetical protein